MKNKETAVESRPSKTSSQDITEPSPATESSSSSSSARRKKHASSTEQFLRQQTTSLGIFVLVGLVLLSVCCLVPGILILRRRRNNKATPAAVPVVETNSSSSIQSMSPTPVETANPSSLPTLSPNEVPTTVPSAPPSIVKSGNPTVVNSRAPSDEPSNLPSAATTISPTSMPSTAPPTSNPTLMVTTTAPTTMAPTVSPTEDVPTRPPRTDDGCNGSPLLCSRRINQVLFATAHNAPATSRNLPLAFSQRRSVRMALRTGIRGLHMKVGTCGDGELALISSVCLLGKVDPRSTLQVINNFLAIHSREVLILPMELDDMAGGGQVSLSRMLLLMQITIDATGKSLASRLYVHERGTNWPTLQELIDADTRVVVFVSNKAVPSDDVCLSRSCPAGFHSWGAYGIATDRLNSVPAPGTMACTVSGSTIFSNGDFFAVNLAMGVSSVDAAKTTNTATFLAPYLRECAQKNKRAPNLVVVDFWSEGTIVNAVDTWNADYSSPTSSPSVAPTTRAPLASPTSGPSSRPTTLAPIAQPTLGPTRGPLVSPGATFDLICQGLGDRELCYDLLDPATHRGMAYEWIMANTNLATYSPPKIRTRFALAALYFSTNGDTWTNNDGWLTDADECTWHSDTRDPCLGSRIFYVVRLMENNMSGTLPEDIGLLTSVISWTLNDMPIGGSIPEQIGRLTKLKHLELETNLITGPLPNTLGQLKLLTTVYLQGNRLTGTLPSSIGQLSNVGVFRVEKNSLTGDLPPEICATFSVTKPRSFADCNEISVPCFSHCCVDEEIACTCQQSDATRC